MALMCRAPMARSLPCYRSRSHLRGTSPRFASQVPSARTMSVLPPRTLASKQTRPRESKPVMQMGKKKEQQPKPTPSENEEEEDDDDDEVAEKHEPELSEKAKTAPQRLNHIPDVDSVARVRNSLEPILSSIVRIDVVMSEPDYSIPWQQLEPEEACGSGCIIAGPDGKLRILTNAHVVEHHTFVQIRKQGTPGFRLATVDVICTESDLALLSLEDESFLQGTSPLEFSGTPALQSAAYVLGFPEGGDAISVTKGIVSRMELSNHTTEPYGFDQGPMLLTLQIDAAINQGNSGGPVVNEQNKIIGIVFARLGGWSENVGYVVPSENVLHFLEDVDANREPRFPSICFRYQSCENPSLRAHQKLKADQQGIIVTQVDALSHAKGLLQRGDVITQVDNVPIAGDGTISATVAGIANAEHLRLSFQYLFARKFLGAPIEITVLREGVELKLQTVAEARKYLIPLHDDYPSYFMTAGLLFVAMTEKYRSIINYPSLVGRYYYHNIQQEEGQEIVVLMKLMVDEINVGFSQDDLPSPVVSFNGTRIKSLKQLVELVENSKDEFFHFDFESGESIILEREKALASNRRIMRRYHIPALKSLNLEPDEDPSDAGSRGFQGSSRKVKAVRKSAAKALRSRYLDDE